MVRREAVRRELTWMPVAGVTAFLLFGAPAMFGDSALTWAVAMSAALPVALAANATPRASFLSTLLGALLLGWVRATDALLFLLTVGPFGMLLGWGSVARMRQLVHWACCAATLAAGMLAASYGLHVHAPWTGLLAAGPLAAAPLFVLGPCAYAALWFVLLDVARRHVFVALPGWNSGAKGLTLGSPVPQAVEVRRSGSRQVPVSVPQERRRRLARR